MTEENKENGEKLSAPPDFDGPTSNRQCTDILCLLLLICMWISMTGLGIYAMQNGDYRLILYPLDYEGNVCGTDYGVNPGGVAGDDGAVGGRDMTEFPYLYYVNDYGGGVCVKECPKIENLTDPHTLVTYDGLFQTEEAFLPPSNISIADYSNSTEDGNSNNPFSDPNNPLSSLSSLPTYHTCTTELCYPNNDTQQSYTSYGVNQGKGYAYYALDTHQVLWRCVATTEATEALNAIVNPTVNGSDASDQNNDNGINVSDVVGFTNSTALKQGYDFWQNLYGDLWVARYFILGLGFGAPLVVGFAYTFLLRIPCVLSIMVWFSIFATIAIFFAAAWYAGDIASQWTEANNADPPISRTYTQQEINTATYGSYILYAVGAALIVLFLFMRKRIQLAMGCVKEASKAMMAMPAIIMFPVFQGLGFMCFMIAWCVYAAYLASMGEFSTNTYGVGNFQVTVRTFEFSDFVVKCGWYMLFCFFWSGQFILAMGEIIFAMSVAKWYFSRDKSTIGNLTVISSVSASLWYHSGTAAFGSLIIAIIKLIRSFIAYLQRKAEEMNNSLARAVLCCCQCCFWCLEKCMRFLNKNAYIQTAIFGTGFCTSSKEAFFLILRNAARIGAITYVSGGVVFVGKIFITTLTAGVSYFVMSDQIRDELYSIIGPLFFIGAIAWFIAGMFMGIYDMGIATILQCFVADEEMFENDQMYAEGGLKDWVDSHG